MSYKRVLVMQDISCVGQCSMAVALPVLAVCGVEACPLPTEILSTHTGGFWKPAVTYLDGALGPIWRHWKESGIRFDVVYTGYLGSVEAIRTAEIIARELMEPGGRLVVDPAMGDHGRLYAGLDRKYAAHMERLCREADIILPNLTEAAMLAGVPWQEKHDEDYVNQIMGNLPQDTVVLTGVGFREGQTGVLLRDRGMVRHYGHESLGHPCSGTGDLFAAGFVGALCRGRDTYRAAQIAADFTCRCVKATLEAPAHWYGVKFEPILPELAQMVGEQELS